MANADFNKAIAELEKTVDNFEKMTQAEKEKAAEQMANLADALQQARTTPRRSSRPSSSFSRWA